MDDFQKRVEDKLDKLDEKIDLVSDRLHGVDITLAKQEANLDEHIRRTRLAEENIALLRADVVPIQKLLMVMESILKLIGFVAVLVGLLVGLMKIFGL